MATSNLIEHVSFEELVGDMDEIHICEWEDQARNWKCSNEATHYLTFQCKCLSEGFSCTPCLDIFKHLMEHVWKAPMCLECHTPITDYKVVPL